jgi:hypothetical protein
LWSSLGNKCDFLYLWFLQILANSKLLMQHCQGEKHMWVLDGFMV